MFEIELRLILLFLFVIKCGNGWVFNNVAFEDLMTDLDIEDESDNEIDAVLYQQRFSLIYPGTKWCGAGDIAEGYDDLGTSKETDLCCREHDYCPDIIPGGGTKYNLTNDAFHTRLNCQCDETFRLCLRKVNSKTSKTIGKIYFDALGTKCFRNDYPVTGCLQRGGWLNSKCLRHSYNTSAEQCYQWFDVPNY